MDNSNSSDQCGKIDNYATVDSHVGWSMQNNKVNARISAVRNHLASHLLHQASPRSPRATSAKGIVPHWFLTRGHAHTAVSRESSCLRTTKRPLPMEDFLPGISSGSLGFSLASLQGAPFTRIESTCEDPALPVLLPNEDSNSVHRRFPCAQSMSSAIDCRISIDGRGNAVIILVVAVSKWTFTGALFYKRKQTLEALLSTGSERPSSRWSPKWRHGIAVVCGEVVKNRKGTITDYI